MLCKKICIKFLCVCILLFMFCINSLYLSASEIVENNKLYSDSPSNNLIMELFGDEKISRKEVLYNLDNSKDYFIIFCIFS